MYANLHTHSDFSNVRLLDSINKIEPLFQYAGELQLTGLALTDHECISGWVDALNVTKSLKEKGVLPSNFKTVLGNEVYLINSREEVKNPQNKSKFYHAILLAKNLKGNEQIRRLSSIAWKNLFVYKNMERVPVEYKEIEEVIGNEKGNIIFSTACLGSFFAEAILNFVNNPTQDNKYPIHDFITWCIEWFGEENVFIEIQPNPYSQEQLAYNKKAIEIAKAYGLRWIATTDAHFIKEKDREIHKAYLNSKDGEREIDDFYKTCYLMSYEEIKDKLSANLDIADVELALSNTNIILDMCEEYSLNHPRIIPEINIDDVVLTSRELYKYTEYEYIQKYVNSADKYDRYLIVQLEQGIIKRQKNYTPEILDRLNTELDVLWAISEHTGDKLSKYFIVAQKLIEIMWNEGDSLVGAGRGSAGGFYLGYLLDIHQVDSIKENMPYWRFMNKGRLDDFPDIDIDSQTTKRKQILNSVKNYFGHDKVINIITFGTEASKSSLLTACRGLNINSDTGQYLADMIPVERGKNRSLAVCFYGDEENGIKPLTEFIREVEKYPKLKETSLYIEGLINKRSTHASGVYIYNEPYWKHNSLMRSPNGLEVTAFTMKNSDELGGLKFDFLSIEALDVIRTTLDLLIKDNVIQPEKTLKETYNKYLHPDVLNYDNVDMWNKVANREILKLFQFETSIGGECVNKAKPLNLVELTTINSLMRLMSDSTEQPIDKYLRFRSNIEEWYQEMESYGLTRNEQKVLKKYLSYTYGVSATQEDMMQLVMDKDISNFSIQNANRIRKGVSKKSEKIIEEMKNLFFSEGKKAGTSEAMLHYVWDTQIQPQTGYSFSYIHAFEYALIALQEMNLATKYPILYWNTACLSVDASANNEKEEENISTDYGKVAKAIGNMQLHGVKIALPDINTADFGFKADIKNNQIVFGLKGINGIGDDVVQEIIQNRPYTSLEDFINRAKITKNSHIIKLIKAGAFDQLEQIPREDIMKKYITMIYEPKSKLNMQNFNMLVEFDLIPSNYSRYIGMFYLKKRLNRSIYKTIPNKNPKLKKKHEDRLIAIKGEAEKEFYSQHFSTEDIVEYVNDSFIISEKKFVKEYDKHMQVIKDWIADNTELLNKLNQTLWQNTWDKYCEGNISQWEMESLCFYYTSHELAHLNKEKYGVVNFFELPPKSVVVGSYKYKGKENPKFDIVRIAGTVLDRDKHKHTVSLLTTEGVVTVKMYAGTFTAYDKQVSEEGSDGKKTILERGWFQRGNKLLICGYRRENQFVVKKYKDSIYQHSIALIKNIDLQGNLEIISERTVIE